MSAPTGLESQAKLGILRGSLLSAAVGIAILLTTQRHAEPLSASMCRCEPLPSPGHGVAKHGTLGGWAALASLPWL